MKNIWRNYIYLGKNIYRDFGFTFWGLLYPIILASFFYIAFSGLIGGDIDDINIGVEKGNPIAYILGTIDIINLVDLDEANIEASLVAEEIDAYVKEDLSLIVDRSGINQTIVKGILDQIKQTVALGVPMENFDFEVDYIKETSQEANAMLVIFYSLIAMVSTYGVFPGIETAIISQANLTNIAARINVTPIKKSTLISSGAAVGLTINLASNILLLLFLQLVLGLDLLKNIGYSSVFILLGNLFGISLGMFIGASNKRSPGVKTMLAIVSTLFLSFLAGLMLPNVKVLIDENIPILGKVNPIAIVTNSLYRINILDNTSNLTTGIVLLILYSIILMVISYLFLRRRQYDSI